MYHKPIDIIEYLKKQYKLGYPVAIDFLGELCGINVDNS